MSSHTSKRSQEKKERKHSKHSKHSKPTPVTEIIPDSCYEEIEIVARHSELVIHRLENLSIYLSEHGELAKAFEEKKKTKTKELIDFLQEYYTALEKKQKPPKLPERKPGVTPWPVTLLKYAAEPYKLTRYCVQWCHQARKCLISMAENVSDFDIRWNQLMTIRFCQIFTAYCKVILFLNNFEFIQLVIDMIPPYIDDIKSMKDYIKDHAFTRNFVKMALKNPIDLIKSNIERIGEKINRLAATLGTFFAQLMGSFPLVNWSIFSIFSKRHDAPETTLPEDEFFILQNISLLKDTMLFFVILFKDITKTDDPFSVVIQNILTESPYIQITHSNKFTVQHFLKLIKKKEGMEKFVNHIAFIAQNKYGTAHQKRIQNITILLEEIKNMCEYDNKLLCQFFPNVISLCSLAHYELVMYFHYQNIIDVHAFDMLAVVLDIIKLVRINQLDIQRFFMFNLSTIDIEFLKKQLEQVDPDSDIRKIANTLVQGLETLNLDNFDNGEGYNYFAFKITYGRILDYYNKLRKTSIVSYAEPIFEHLTTVFNHVDYADDPLACIFNYCPVYNLWNNYKELEGHINNPTIPISRCITILEIFAFFDLDPNIYVRPQVIENLKTNYQQLKNLLFNRARKDLQLQFQFDSPTNMDGMKTRILSRTSNKQELQQTPQTLPLNVIAQYYQQNRSAAELRTSFTRIPHQITVFDMEDSPSDYFEKSISQGFTNFIIPSSLPNPLFLDCSFSDAFQILWQIFAQMGKPFPRNMFESRLIEGTQYKSEQYLQQVNLLNGTIDIDDNSVVGKKLVDNYQQKIREFVKSGYKSALYLTHLKGFYNTKKKEATPNEKNKSSKQPQSPVKDKTIYSDFFSAKAINYMIKNLGINCALAYDRIVTHQIAKDIIEIFNVFVELSNDLNSWLNDFKSKNILPRESLTSPQLDKCCELMINLGCSAVLRDLIKNEMCNAMSDAVPGLQQMVDAAIDRINVTLSGKEQLIIETVSHRDTLYFVQQIIEKGKIDKQTDFIKFMFFIGLLLNNNKWDKIQYISDFETITGNLHLFPKALELFFDVRQSLFLTPDDLALETGTKTLLQVFGVVVNNKKQQNGSGYQMAATKLVIMFPRVIHTIQFGWIEEVFPNYSYDNFNIKKMKEQEDKKDKKNKEKPKKVERSSSTRKSTKK